MGKNNPATRFGVSTTSGLQWSEANQKTEGGLWIRLEKYEMEAGERYAVQVSPDSEEQGRAVAEAMVAVRGYSQVPPTRATRSLLAATRRLR